MSLSKAKLGQLSLFSGHKSIFSCHVNKLAYLTQYAPRFIAVNFAANWVIPKIFQGIIFRVNVVSIFKVTCIL